MSTEKDDIAKIQRVLNTYEVRVQGPNRLYHVKQGSLPMNIMCGCCGQCYKYNIDLSDSRYVRIESTVPCNGWWGGAIGAGKESSEKDRVRSAMMRAFPDRQVM